MTTSFDYFTQETNSKKDGEICFWIGKMIN